MPWTENPDCPHCGAPRSDSGKEREDRMIYCRKCHKWFKARRFAPDALPAAPATKMRLIPKPQAPSIDRSAVLPEDLTGLGFHLVFYDTRMVAVSNNYGCSDASADLAVVVKSARNIAGFCRWAQQKQREEGRIDTNNPILSRGNQ